MTTEPEETRSNSMDAIARVESKRRKKLNSTHLASP